MNYTLPFSAIDMNMVDVVGGKNASLGEMFQHLVRQGIEVPDGFATTAAAYRAFLEENQLKPFIAHQLGLLDLQEFANLKSIGAAIRGRVLEAEFSSEFANAIVQSWTELKERCGGNPFQVAVRSSATAEDLPSASFAGQLESFLNVEGPEELLETSKRCFASLYTDRAIKYRFDKGFSQTEIALSVGVQQLVRADKACSGVAFTLDPDSGFEEVALITGAWGLGENVVQGNVNVDEFYIHKPTLQQGYSSIISRKMGDKSLTMVFADPEDQDQKVTNIPTPPSRQVEFILDDTELIQLAQWIVKIQAYYGRHMDIEWAKDGLSGKLFIVQARPETVHALEDKKLNLSRYRLKEQGEELTRGISLGQKITSGRARCLDSPDDAHKLETGEILVTRMTNPDWDPIMKKAAGIVTERGGRTSHAAIVARELGTVAVVGTGNATSVIKDGTMITLSCAEGSIGKVYRGKLEWEKEDIRLDTLPQPQTLSPMLILGDPDRAFSYAQLPHKGIGLMRMEFVINHQIGIHPMALLHLDQMEEGPEKRAIVQRCVGYTTPEAYFVQRLAEGIGTIAAAFYPEPVVVRCSDFKTNEYANLLGGHAFEPKEENPMLGFRGASRYYHPSYKAGFGLECAAIKHVREVMGLSNVKVLVPFCRTPLEGRKVLETLTEFGLEKGKNGLEVWVMVELPSNAVLASEFAKLFDGFSIGSNDLTQLTLGLDRDSEFISSLFDENNEAVKKFIQMTIQAAKEKGISVGLCGQAPSDFPEFTRFLVEQGIDSISFQPDAFIRGITQICRSEEPSIPA